MSLSSRGPKPYELADKAITSLNRKAIKRAEQCRRHLQIDKFDELNVIKEIDKLYDGMDTDNRVRLKDLFAARYLEVLYWLSEETHKRVSVTDDEVDELAEIYVSELLAEPNPVTHYAYDTEVYRKRDRAKEAVNAVTGTIKKSAEIDKAVKQWSIMTDWYCDFTADGANVQAIRDSGYEYVKWVTQDDEKVCRDCHRKNGKIYRIDEIPDKDHPRCRCWVIPYTGDKRIADK